MPSLIHRYNLNLEKILMRFIGLIFFLLSFSVSAQEIVQNVDATAFNKFISSGGYEIIDLRTQDEINRKGKIAGAKEIDYLAVDSEKRIADLDRSKKYL